MKKIIFLLLLLPINLFGQEYLRFPSHYDSEGTATQICNGNVEKFLSDTVEWKVEKGGDRWVTSWIDKDGVKSKLNKIFVSGSAEYSGRTNGGYWFFIAVIDPKEETKILKTLQFEVDHYSQKIKTIEVLKEK